MRRLVGLIALLVLILAGAWLARNDFDLNRIAETDTLFSPASEGGPTTSPEKTAPAAGTVAAGAPEASETESDVAAASQEAGPPPPSTEASDADGTAEVPPAGTEAAEKSEPAEMAAAGAASQAETDAETETAMVDPAGTGESEAAPPDTVVPSFDIVRVEPTGETVIAGVAEPQATVEVLNGPEAVATAEANQRGEWALVLEVPLPPGSHDLGIRTTSQDHSQVTLSDQRVAVSVPETPDEEPLVVLNQPDAPSQVIQILDDAEAPAGSELAAGADATADSPASPVATEAEPSLEAPWTESEVAAVPESEATGETPPASAPERAASETEPPAAATQAPSAESEVAAVPESEATSETPPSSTSESSTSEMAVLETESPSAATQAPSPDTDVAARAEPKPMAAPSSPDGATPPPATPSAGLPPAEAAAVPERDPTVASSTPSDSAETATPATAPPADGAGETAASGRSPEPPITMAEQPAGEGPSSTTEQAAVAPAGEDASAAAAGTGDEPSRSSSAAASTIDPPEVAEEPQVAVAAVEAETNGSLFIAGTATTSESVRVYLDEEFVGETTPTESGTWLLETTREMAPDEYKIRADQVDSGSGAVIARAEVPFEREIDVATLKPTGESVDAGTAEVSGTVADPRTVIIRRGDNLWKISRKLYGRGIRYSTIYQANRDQIRNPNLIYPGQVFVLPAGDTAWGPQQ